MDARRLVDMTQTRMTRLAEVKAERDAALLTASRYELALFDILGDTPRVYARGEYSEDGDQFILYLLKRADPLVVTQQWSNGALAHVDVRTLDEVDRTARETSRFPAFDVIARFRHVLTKGKV